MIKTSLLLASGLLQVSALSLPIQHSFRGRQVAAAGPSLPLLSDFKKDNVSASWAPGHPKVWSEAEKTFSVVDPPPAIRTNGLMTEDGKFLFLTNATDTDVINVETGEVVSSLKVKYQLLSLYTSISNTPDGQYDFFVAHSDWTQEDVTTRQRISQDGAPVGELVDYPGCFFTNDRWDPIVVDGDGNRVLLTTGTTSEIYVYNLDDANASVLTLIGHTDTPIAIRFSPDKKRIASTGFDGYVKVWDAATGKVVIDIPPEHPDPPYNQNWLVRWSPDAKSLIYTIGSPGEDAGVRLVPLDSNGNPTDIITVGPFDWVWWVRAAEYNSDGSLLAIGGFGWLRIFDTSDMSIVQEWRVNDALVEPLEEAAYLHWFDNDTKIRWNYINATEVYDFEKNLKYRWGPGEDDLPDPVWTLLARDWYPVEEKGWFGNFDSDSKMRIWPLPE